VLYLKENNKKLIALVIVIITMIRCIVTFVQFNYNYTNTSGYKNYTVKVLNVEKESIDKKVYLVALKKDNNHTDKFILNIYDNNEVNFSKGDIVNIVGKISIPQLLGNPRRI